MDSSQASILIPDKAVRRSPHLLERPDDGVVAVVVVVLVVLVVLLSREGGCAVASEQQRPRSRRPERCTCSERGRGIGSPGDTGHGVLLLVDGREGEMAPAHLASGLVEVQPCQPRHEPALRDGSCPRRRIRGIPAFPPPNHPAIFGVSGSAGLENVRARTHGPLLHPGRSRGVFARLTLSFRRTPTH